MEASKMKVGCWCTDKPVFDMECIFATASLFAKEYYYSIWEIKKCDSLFEEYKSLNTRRNEEIERLKGLIEVAHKDSHILFVPDKFKEELWQQFKTENNL